MKIQNIRIALSAGALLVGTALFSANAEAREKVRIGFREVGPHHVSTGLPEQLHGAAEHFNNIYASEDGVRGLSYTPEGALLVMCGNRRDSSRIWNLMLQRGDAGQEAGVAYFYYGEPNPPEPEMGHFGTVYLDEGTGATVRVTGGQSQFVYGYKVTLHEKCSVSKSGVLAVNGPIAPTRLTRTVSLGNTRAYYYAVNNGQGAAITGISVALQPSNRIFILDNCEVNIWAQY